MSYEYTGVQQVKPTKEYLFIGGSYDGDRMVIATHLRTVVLPKKSRTCANRFIEWRPDPQQAIQEVYHKRGISGSDAMFDVFVLSGLDGDDCLRRLLEHYHTER